VELRIISVGRLSDKAYRQKIDEYLRWIGAWARITVVDGIDEKISSRAKATQEKEARRLEAQKVLSLVGGEEYLVVLDARGQQMTSEQMAARVGRLLETGKKRVNFVVGGPSGLDSSVISRADAVWALSSLTFPHQLAVLVLCEQLYRAFAIIRSHPYHK